MPLRLVMMGTGTFALPTYLKLYETPHQVVALVTQPDRSGPGKHRHENPMKTEALARGTPVFQPDKVNSPESLAQLREYQADLIVVAAYGQILSAELLAIPTRGAVNLHASLLPKYRGAAPIQYAVWEGETETGVTLFQIEPKLDAGPILGMVKTPIGPKETSGELAARLAPLAAELTAEVLEKIAADRALPLSQAETASPRARKIAKEQGAIDWSKTAHQIDCHIRAMQPWPMPYAYLHAGGRPPLRLLILEVSPSPMGTVDWTTAGGTVLNAQHGRLIVSCGDGAIELVTLQPAGKRVMSAAEFLRGTPLKPGDQFRATE